MKNKRFSVGQLFYNEKFIALFSVVLAVMIWVTITSSSDGPEVTTSITDVPINIELSQNAKDKGLNVYYPQAITQGSVNVKGNSLALSKLSNTDLYLTAPKASSIIEKGTYELELVAKSNSSTTGYTIDQDTLSVKYITILVDTQQELEFPVKDNIKYKVDSQYFVSSVEILPENITISGPESIMQKISYIQVDYNINKILKQTESFTAPISIYDSNSNILSKSDEELLNISHTQVKVSLHVLKRINLPIKANFINQPSGFDYSSMVSLEKSDIDIACSENLVGNLSEVQLSPIDFSKIGQNDKVFEQELILADGCKNLSEKDTIKVTLNIGNIIFKDFIVTNFNAMNTSDSISVNIITKELKITVVGTKDQVTSLKSSDIIAQLDFKDKNSFIGSTQIPVSFSIPSKNMCWVNGDYKVNVTIKNK